MSQKQNLYVGRAGQMAVMAEFLLRGWNVALPEVDVGEDMLVVEDETGDLWRIQVNLPYRNDWSRWPIIRH